MAKDNTPKRTFENYINRIGLESKDIRSYHVNNGVPYRPIFKNFSSEMGNMNWFIAQNYDIPEDQVRESLSQLDLNPTQEGFRSLLGILILTVGHLPNLLPPPKLGKEVLEGIISTISKNDLSNMASSIDLGNKLGISATVGETPSFGGRKEPYNLDIMDSNYQD